jgi:hypothetical protein
VPRKKSSGWSAGLAHQVEIMKGPKLETLGDARDYILKLPKKRHSSQWDAAVRCLLQAAETGNADDIKAATRAIELAFLYQASFPSRTNKNAPAKAGTKCKETMSAPAADPQMPASMWPAAGPARIQLEV